MRPVIDCLDCRPKSDGVSSKRMWGTINEEKSDLRLAVLQHPRTFGHFVVTVYVGPVEIRLDLQWFTALDDEPDIQRLQLNC